MNVDELLSSLQTLPRPRLSPFFAARVAQQTRSAPPAARPAPRALRLYWLALAFVSGVVLLQSWIGVVMIIAAAGIAALIPAGAPSPTAIPPEPRR